MTFDPTVSLDNLRWICRRSEDLCDQSVRVQGNRRNQPVVGVLAGTVARVQVVAVDRIGSWDHRTQPAQ